LLTAFFLYGYDFCGGGLGACPAGPLGGGPGCGGPWGPGGGGTGEAVAHLGVIGPTRMDYPATMTAVRAVARHLSRVPSPPRAPEPRRRGRPS